LKEHAIKLFLSEQSSKHSQDNSDSYYSVI
jgi:hypothetical protein